MESLVRSVRRLLYLVFSSKSMEMTEGMEEKVDVLLREGFWHMHPLPGCRVWLSFFMLTRLLLFGLYDSLDTMNDSMI